MEITTLALLLVVILVTAFLLLSRKTNLPPGPWAPIPFMGFLPNIAYALYKGKPIYKFFMELGQQCGRVFSFTIFGRPVVVLNDHAAIREAFQDDELNGRFENDFTNKIFSRIYNHWEHIGPFRIFVQACFRQFGIGTSRFEEPTSKESSCLIEELVKLKGKPVDLTGYLNNAVANNICKVVFGSRFELSDERIHRLTHLLNHIDELVGSGAWELFIPINTKRKQEMHKAADEVLDFINTMIEDHRKNFDLDNLNDVIDRMLNQLRRHESDDPNSFRNPKNMAGQYFLLFLAGTDTTATTLQWATQYLTRYPEIQNRVHREIDEVIGRNRLPKLADRINLPYTQATIAEIHRIVSLIPLSVPHVAEGATTFRGYTIPKNSILISNLYAVMHNPELWKDPEEFRPERFLDSKGTFCEADEVIPFGLGRRGCVGEALARQELFIFLSHLLHQFKFEKTSVDAPLPTLTPIDGAVVRPEPYKLRVIHRE